MANRPGQNPQALEHSPVAAEETQINYVPGAEYAVLDFGHWDSEFVSDLGFRAQNFRLKSDGTSEQEQKS